jgi:hypothetical protein
MIKGVDLGIESSTGGEWEVLEGNQGSCRDVGPS